MAPEPPPTRCLPSLIPSSTRAHASIAPDSTSTRRSAVPPPWHSARFAPIPPEFAPAPALANAADSFAPSIPFWLHPSTHSIARALRRLGCARVVAYNRSDWIPHFEPQVDRLIKLRRRAPGSGFFAPRVLK